MVTFVIIISIFFLILGLVGSVLPIVPGPPLSFLGLLLLHLFTSFNLEGDYLFYFGAFAVIITLLDYWLQIYSVKYFGGGRSSTFGVVLGILCFLLARSKNRNIKVASILGFIPMINYLAVLYYIGVPKREIMPANSMIDS